MAWLKRFVRRSHYSAPPSPAVDHPEPKTTTKPGVLLQRYLAVLVAERNLSAYTIRNYAADLGHLFGYLREHEVDPLELTRVSFRGYLASMMDAGVARGSITRRTSTARSFYKWLRLSGVMSEDPLANVRGPKQAKRLPHVLTVEHITQLIAAADAEHPAGLRDRALLELMYACGVRVSEAVSLDTGVIDLEQRTMMSPERATSSAASLWETRLAPQSSATCTAVAASWPKDEGAEPRSPTSSPAKQRGARNRSPQAARSKITRAVPESFWRAAVPAGGAAHRTEVRPRRRPRRARASSPAAAYVRDSSARRRRGPPCRAGIDGPRQPQYHADLPPRDRGAAAEGGRGLCRRARRDRRSHAASGDTHANRCRRRLYGRLQFVRPGVTGAPP